MIHAHAARGKPVDQTVPGVWNWANSSLSDSPWGLESVTMDISVTIGGGVAHNAADFERITRHSMGRLAGSLAALGKDVRKEETEVTEAQEAAPPKFSVGDQVHDEVLQLANPHDPVSISR